ncbi:hypothetical protein EDD15DRAFT_2410723 [Pisolithus albus]|nr:hypothetical protein EDD15DRAFT_2410723 [Pisolithus albus]
MHQVQLTLPELVFGVLSNKEYENGPIALGFASRVDDIITMVMKYSETGGRKVRDLVIKIATEMYVSEVERMAAEGCGFRFDAAHTNVEQLEQFSMDELARKMKYNAPHLWETLGGVLARHASRMSTDMEDGTGEREEEDAYWDALDGCDMRKGWPTRTLVRQQAVMTIKKIVIVSIIVQHANQRANYLQAILGIFLQSAHAPQKVVETLARMGLSISISSIDAAIVSLSKESQCTIKTLGRTLLAAYAYDNFDIDMKTSDQRVEKSIDTLKHLTSGLLFPLQHGTTLEDLRCSRMLWEQSTYNIHAREMSHRSGKTYRDLLELHPESPSEDGISCRMQYNAWKMLSDLVEHGPVYFRRFQEVLGEPEVVEAIPVIKTPIVAARAMEFVNSTVSGNIQSITGLLAQAGIHDPNEGDDLHMPDISDYVVLFHGDLGTAEHVQAMLQRRAMEDSPWNRCQYVVFVPGLFHLKMAAADALWRAFIHPVAARSDETSLMHDVGVLWPKETGIYQSKPGFRRMHQLVTYSGICRRLDCWRVEVANVDPSIKNLDDFAATEPTFSQLKEIADILSRKYVATYTLRRVRQRAGSQRDMQAENAMVINKYMLLYEELTHAMNSGDIGRVELCIVAWILVFKATGKHKYAAHMTEFLINVHFVYPPGLRHAVRYSMLVNPTGKKGSFRGVDWCVELNNLFTKVINGGKFSNHTIPRVLLESPLVQVYRNLHGVFQKNFLHTHLSTKRQEADMTLTFAELCKYFEKYQPHKMQTGRTSKLCMDDLIDVGHALMEKTEVELERDGLEVEEEGENALTLDDIAIELRL